MAKSLSDRGTREYYYSVIPTGTKLQEAIQLAGLNSRRVELEEIIRDLPRPTTDHENTAYNNLVTQLTRWAANPNTGTLAEWNTLNQQVLAYFNSRPRIYLSPAQPKTRGYFLDENTKTLHFFDGKTMHEMCVFSGQNWAGIKQLLSKLFVPDMSVSMGLSDNYLTLQPDQFIQLLRHAQIANPDLDINLVPDGNFLPFYARLREHAEHRALLGRNPDKRTTEQLGQDIVDAITHITTDYLLSQPEANEGTPTAAVECFIMERITMLVSSRNPLELTNASDELADAVARYDSTRAIGILNFFHHNDIDRTLNILKDLRSSRFLDRIILTIQEKKQEQEQIERQKAAAQIDIDQSSKTIEQLNYARAKNIQLQEELAEKARIEALKQGGTDHVLNFDISAEDVTVMWEEHRVTKDAFAKSLQEMEEKLNALATAASDDGIELNEIPLPKELVQDGETNEGKTVVQHIQDCIARYKAKIARDTSQSNVSFYQADCALLYAAINQIIRFQFSGEDSDFMVTEEQRGVYNDIAVELKTILNNTQKQPIKALEVMGSVEPVRAEITRLIEFHNELRRQLVEYQAELRSMDQGTFFNDIAAFIKGPFTTKQQELEALLASLHGIREDAFNVLAPETESQRTVCAAVVKLTEEGKDTELASKLQDVLLYVQKKTPKGVASATDEQALTRRTYIPIGVAKGKPVSEVNQRKNSENEPRFIKLMGQIQTFAEPLVDQESPQIHEFFGGYDLKLIESSELDDEYDLPHIPTLVKQDDDTYQFWGRQSDNTWNFTPVTITAEQLTNARINEADFGDKRRLHIELGSELFTALANAHTPVLAKPEAMTAKALGRLGAFSHVSGHGARTSTGSFDLDSASDYDMTQTQGKK